MSTSSNTGSTTMEYIAIITTALAALKSIGISIKGMTRHLGWSNTTTIVSPVALAIDNLCSDNLSESNYALLDNMDFAEQVINYIRNCGWWKVGNDQEGAVSTDRPAGNLDDTVWRVLLWGMDNSPLGNYGDGYSAITEVFQNTFYAKLTDFGAPELTGAIDVLLSQMCGQTSAIYNSSNLSSTVMAKVQSLLGINANGSSNGTGGTKLTTKTSSSTGILIAIVLIVGGLFIMKEK